MLRADDSLLAPRLTTAFNCHPPFPTTAHAFTPPSHHVVSRPRRAAAAGHGVCVRSTLAAGQHVTLSLAVHYLAAGQEHWDNNEGGNYTFDLPCE